MLISANESTYVESGMLEDDVFVDPEKRRDHLEVLKAYRPKVLTEETVSRLKQLGKQGIPEAYNLLALKHADTYQQVT